MMIRAHKPPSSLHSRNGGRTDLRVRHTRAGRQLGRWGHPSAEPLHPPPAGRRLRPTLPANGTGRFCHGFHLFPQQQRTRQVARQPLQHGESAHLPRIQGP